VPFRQGIISFAQFNLGMIKVYASKGPPEYAYSRIYAVYRVSRMIIRWKREDRSYEYGFKNSASASA
jgi:hypothetical protein